MMDSRHLELAPSSGRAKVDYVSVKVMVTAGLPKIKSQIAKLIRI